MDNAIQLTPQVVDAYRELITNPAKNGLELDAITDCFHVDSRVTAKHVLAETYIKHINKPMPKLILYIIMDELYGKYIGKGEDGHAGYRLMFRPPERVE
jgi:hypothetical protein